jgi:hypothetical protein
VNDELLAELIKPTLVSRGFPSLNSFAFPVSAKCRVRDQASPPPNLKTEDVIMCCLVRATPHLRGR